MIGIKSTNISSSPPHRALSIQVVNSPIHSSESPKTLIPSSITASDIKKIITKTNLTIDTSSNDSTLPKQVPQSAKSIINSIGKRLSTPKESSNQSNVTQIKTAWSPFDRVVQSPSKDSNSTTITKEKWSLNGALNSGFNSEKNENNQQFGVFDISASLLHQNTIDATNMLNEAKEEILILKNKLKISNDSLEEIEKWKSSSQHYTSLLTTNIIKLFDKIDNKDKPNISNDKEYIKQICTTLTNIMTTNVPQITESVKKKMNRRTTLNSVHFNPSKITGFSNKLNINQINNTYENDSLNQNNIQNNNHILKVQSFSLSNFGFKMMADDIEDQLAKLFNFVVNIQLNYGDDFSIANILSKNKSKEFSKSDFIYKLETNHDDYCTKKSFYISFFALDIFDDKCTLQSTIHAYNKISVLSDRGQKKFNSRLFLNDFSKVIYILASIKYPELEDETKQIELFLKDVSPLVREFEKNSEIVKRVICGFAPIVDDSIFELFAHYQEKLYLSYKRCKNYSGHIKSNNKHKDIKVNNNGNFSIKKSLSINGIKNHALADQIHTNIFELYCDSNHICPGNKCY